MLNKKVLLAVLLIAIPSFALLNPKEAKSVADSFNEKIAKEQLPTLLDEIDKAVNLACEKGEYDTSVDIGKYNIKTVEKVKKILDDKGYDYMLGPLPGQLFISWD